MYLSQITIENFRIFGPKEANRHADIALSPGLNILVGENDSGKTTVIDAIRIVLQTSSHEYHRLSEHDFHIPNREPAGDPAAMADISEEEKTLYASDDPDDRRARHFTIRCTFSEIDTDQAARYLEWLSVDPENKTVP